MGRKAKLNDPIPHSYFISLEVDEAKCVEEATYRFMKTGKKSRVHLHKFTEICPKDDTCYLAPKPVEEKESAD
jgi:hypothetical protein